MFLPNFVSAEEVWRAAPWTMLFADDIVIVCKTKAELWKRLSRWKRALEEKGFKIGRMKTEYLQLNDFEDKPSDPMWMELQEEAVRCAVRQEDECQAERQGEQKCCATSNAIQQ